MSTRYQDATAQWIWKKLRMHHGIAAEMGMTGEEYKTLLSLGGVTVQRGYLAAEDTTEYWLQLPNLRRHSVKIPRGSRLSQVDPGFVPACILLASLPPVEGQFSGE